jgi:hypothetical protein
MLDERVLEESVVAYLALCNKCVYIEQSGLLGENSMSCNYRLPNIAP